MNKHFYFGELYLFLAFLTQRLSSNVEPQVFINYSGHLN